MHGISWAEVFPSNSYVSTIFIRHVFESDEVPKTNGEKKMKKRQRQK
jgi:hypothetical protein